MDEDVTKPFVIWLDPGLVTGLSSYDLQHSTFMSEQHEPDELVRRLHGLLEVCDGRMEIGWEAYLKVGGPQHGTSKHSDQMIGRVKDFALVHGATVLRSQPSSARRLGSPAFLRRLGWYTPGKPHANDSSRHLLADLLRRKLLPLDLQRKLFPDR